MSILLPDDGHVHDRRRTRRKQGRGILDRLRELSGQPLFCYPVSDNKEREIDAPTGKIRLVTNSWIDNPGRKRASSKRK